MNLLFQQIIGLLLVYKYAILFPVIFFSSFGLPLPAAPSIIAAAAFASQGYLNIVIVLVVVAVGNIGGDMVTYGIIRKYGERFFKWIHLGKIFASPLLKDIEAIENSHKPIIIIVSRFQVQATGIVNIIAGLGHMKFRSFTLYVIIGEILQTIFYGSIGYFFADNWQSLYKTVGALSWPIVLGTIAITTLSSRKITGWILK